MNKLKMYVAFDGAGSPEDGCALVFAKTSKQARKISRNALMDWGCEFLNARVRLIKGFDYLRKEATEDGPHVVEQFFVCPSCEVTQDNPIDDSGLCKGCRDE